MLSSTLLMVVIVVATAVGDYLLKLASLKEQSFVAPEFFLGALLYGVTAAGWVMVMKQMTLAAIGVYFSIGLILFLTALGVFLFEETLRGREMLGLLLAFASLALMSRFS